MTGARTVSAFSGNIDFTTREEFRQLLAGLTMAEFAVIDLSGVGYIDSMALSELIALHRGRIDAGRSPLRVVVGPGVRRLYEISGIGAILPPYASVDDAVAP